MLCSPIQLALIVILAVTNTSDVKKVSSLFLNFKLISSNTLKPQIWLHSILYFCYHYIYTTDHSYPLSAHR